MPQKPSSYVGAILRPLQGFLEELPDQHRKEWSCSIAEAVSERYVFIDIRYVVISMQGLSRAYPTSNSSGYEITMTIMPFMYSFTSGQPSISFNLLALDNDISWDDDTRTCMHPGISR